MAAEIRTRGLVVLLDRGPGVRKIANKVPWTAENSESAEIALDDMYKAILEFLGLLLPPVGIICACCWTPKEEGARLNLKKLVGLNSR